MSEKKPPGGFRIEEATINSVHDAMKRGELTCRRLVELYLDRIAAYDRRGPCLNVVISINPNALEIADMLDKQLAEGGLSGPLHGIPVLLKDNIDAVGMPTTGGSLSLQGMMPADDAFITKKLKAAGALILAKVNLHEFAMWGETASSLLGQTLNPYDLSRTPGGSSGGTGAGIAANFGMVGIGTDSVNSIRSPASACSLAGIRSTLGTVSRDGLIPYSPTQDMAGPITRSVADAVIVFDAICGYDRADDTTAWSIGRIPGTYTAYLNRNGLAGKRLGVLESFFGAKPEHEAVNTAIRHGIEVMRRSGAGIAAINEPIDADELVAGVSVHLYEFKDHLNEYLSKLGPQAQVHSLRDVIDLGKYHVGIEANIKAAEQLSAQSLECKDRLIKRQKLRNQIMKLMADYGLDALVYPHQKRLVVPVGESQLERNGVLGAITGFPSIVVPGGFSQPDGKAPIGVPIGLEILGRPWSEPVLIEIAYSFEQATQFRRPPVCAPPLNQ